MEFDPKPYNGIVADLRALEASLKNGGSMNHEELHWAADAAGMAAAKDCVPRPMVVEGYAPIADGVCGFAWITIKPGNCGFAKYLVKKGAARRAYGGGVSVWVSAFNQSMAKKEAYARAFAQVLANVGIRAYAESRMD